MKKYTLGVDVGGTTVKMGLFNVDGEVLDKWEIKTRTENGGEAILPDIAASALAKLEEKGIAKEEVAGVGYGVPGPINEEGIVPHTANLGWGYKEVTKEFKVMAVVADNTGGFSASNMTELNIEENAFKELFPDYNNYIKSIDIDLKDNVDLAEADEEIQKISFFGYGSYDGIDGFGNGKCRG